MTFVLIYLGQPNTAINIELGETSTIGSAPGARDMTFLELEFDRNHNDLAGLPKAGLDREDSSPMQQLYTTRAIDPLYIS